MAFVVPGTLSISPTSPNSAQLLTFSFIAQEDDIDLASSLFGFSTSWYILYRPSGTTTWNELMTYACNNCFSGSQTDPNISNAGYWSASDQVSAAIPSGKDFPAGTYDFIVVDNGDYSKGIPYSASRTATLTNYVITQYQNPQQTASDVTISVVPTPSDAIVTINGLQSNTVSLPVGSNVSMTVVKYGYTEYSDTFVVSASYAGTTQTIPVSLSTCGAGTAGCNGGTTGSTGCTSTANCVSPQTCVNGVCTTPSTGGSTCASTDYICQITTSQYLPYIIAGGAVLLFLVLSRPVGRGG